MDTDKLAYKELVELRNATEFALRGWEEQLGKLEAHFGGPGAGRSIRARIDVLSALLDRLDSTLRRLGTAEVLVQEEGPQ